MRRLRSRLPGPAPRRSAASASAALVLPVLAAVVLTTGGCRFLAQGPFTGRATVADSARADSALDRDGLVRLDTVAVDSARTGAIRRAPEADSSAAASDSARLPDRPDSLAREAAATDSPAAQPSPDGERPTVEQLLEMGPTYTPYDVSPQLLPGEWLTDLLSDTLAPVVDRHDELSVEDVALFWVLVDRSGEARDAVLHTTSESDAFDQAARVVAERLRFRPAVADGEPVPVWVLKRVSVLMR